MQRLVEESMSAQRPARQGSSSKCVIPKPNSKSAHTQPKHQTAATLSEVLQSQGPNYHTRLNRNVEEAGGKGFYAESDWRDDGQVSWLQKQIRFAATRNLAQEPGGEPRPAEKTRLKDTLTNDGWIPNFCSFGCF